MADRRACLRRHFPRHKFRAAVQPIGLRVGLCRSELDAGRSGGDGFHGNWTGPSAQGRHLTFVYASSVHIRPHLHLKQGERACEKRRMAKEIRIPIPCVGHYAHCYTHTWQGSRRRG